MRSYEVVIILESSLDDDKVRAVTDKAGEIISANDGTPGQVQRWGRRRFAYELNHRWEGYYVLLEMTGEPATVAALDRGLTLTDEVIRHKIVRLPEKKAAPARESASADAAPQTTGV